MNKIFIKMTSSSVAGVLIAFFTGLTMTSAVSQETEGQEGIAPEDAAVWAGLTAGHGHSNMSIGGVLFPNLHAVSAYGHSSAEQSSLAVNDHDPQRDWTIQGLEPSLSLRAGMLQGFVNGTGITDSEGDFSFGLEEGFLKLIDLPLGLELRGGQYLNRFGFQNSIHNHGWFNVDQNLVNGRFLNEGELMTQGGEISWNVPLQSMQASMLSASFGRAEVHEHGHHGEEHGEEAEFEAEGANFSDDLFTIAWLNQYDIDDMNRFQGVLSAAWGDNGYGRNTEVYGAGLEYLWRENGYAAGGQSLRWRNEIMYRNVDAVSGHLPGEEEHHDEHGDEHHDEHGDDDHDEHGDDDHDDHGDEHHDEDEAHRDSFGEVGLYSSVTYGLNDQLEAGLRAGWVSGISEAGLDERFRLSPSLTWYNESRTVQARVQYNWDHSDDFGNEHSIWFQLGLNFGGPEVR
ncbi:MAG: hypothetical protein MK183_04325 [Verrucomicrobiales bacterium]|nr:hypothetical protein [Verrucomicrobiales bacterium]